MRGTPFLKQGFTLGLNTQDSPYTLQEGETRDCLNVVSTSRGAIRKRTGSTRLKTAPAFPAAATVVDTMTRANEDPLANAGAWVALEEAAHGFQIVSNKAQLHAAAELEARRFTTVQRFTPYAGYKVEGIIGSAAAKAHFGIWLLSEWANGKKVSGVFLRVHRENEITFTHRFQLILFNEEEYEVGGVVQGQVIAEGSAKLFSGGSIGITCELEGKVRAWVKYEEAAEWKWEEVCSASNAVANAVDTLGIQAYNPSGVAPTLVNVMFGEYSETSPPFGEAISLAPVKIGATPYMLAHIAGKLYSVSANGEYTEIGALTEGKLTAVVQATENSADATPGAKLGGPVYMTNGTDKPKYWKGTAKGTAIVEWVGGTAGTTEADKGELPYEREEGGEKKYVPNGQFMVLLNDRIFMAGMSNETTTVRSCGFAKRADGTEQVDPTWWPKENAVSFDSEDGEPITGLGTVGKYVLVFKRTKTYVIYDTDALLVRTISHRVGCVAPRSIVETPEGTIFLAQHGIYMTNGSSVKELGYKVRPTIAEAQEVETAAAAYYENHYYLSYKTQLSPHRPSRTLDYDLVLRSWWLHDLTGRQWAEWAPSGESQLMATGPSNEGIVHAFVAGAYKDCGSAYTGKTIEVEREAGEGLTEAYTTDAYWFSPWEVFAYFVFRRRLQAPFILKRLREIFVDGSGEIQVMLCKSFDTKPKRIKTTRDRAKLEEEATDVTTLPTVMRAYGLGQARAFSLGFSGTAGQPMEVDVFALMVDFRK